MKVHIRKCEVFTVVQATESVELDPKKFRKIKEYPYTGNSDREFLEYIAGFDFFELPDDLDDDIRDKLEKIGNEAQMQQIRSSLDDREEIWFELGEPDTAYRKNGEFRTIESSAE